MEQDHQSRLLGNAAGIVIVTIVGMMAGLTFGVVRSWIGQHDSFQQLGLVVSGGFVGTVLALGLAIVFAVLERGSFRSLKKTMVVVAVTGVVFWAIVTLLRDLKANGTL
jgi:hypothetical protein